MSHLIDSAEKLARRAHEGQKRKDGVPYIGHPERVARCLAEAGFDDVTIAAGWLHDTLEDTAISEDKIAALHPELLDVIKAVTEDGSLPWVERKRQFTDTLRDASARSKAVACADRIDNLSDLFAYYKVIGPDLWKKWPERTAQDKLQADQYFLEMLTQTWKHDLIAKLEKLVDEEARIVVELGGYQKAV